MLKKEITYTDFNDEEVTETFYFGLLTHELVELESEYETGIEVWFERVKAANDRNAIVKEFKRIIAMTYGEKSEDGKQFVKNEEVFNRFKNSAAYDELFNELITSEDSAATFVKGVLPAKLMRQVEQAQKEQKVQDKPTGPPPVPRPPQ